MNGRVKIIFQTYAKGKMPKLIYKNENILSEISHVLVHEGNDREIAAKTAQ